MNLTIFSCSTGFHSYPTPNKSYIDKFASEYQVKGRWMDGLSVLDVKRELPLFVYGNDRIVILHIGAVEAFTYPAANIIEWCAEYFLRNPFDPYAITFLTPKIIEASHSLTHKQELFLPVLEPSEFEFVLHQTLHLLQGSQVIVIGMNKPNSSDKPFWTKQALIFNQILEEEAKIYNFNFIDAWNLCPHCVTDNNHLNEEGHNIIYEKVKEKLK
jgi:hypothetical protein